MKKREKASVSPTFLTGKQLESTRNVDTAVSGVGGEGERQVMSSTSHRLHLRWFGAPGELSKVEREVRDIFPFRR